MQVRVGSRWSFISGDSADTAQVVCRQLGMRGGIARNGAVYARHVSGAALLTDVRCKATAASLNDCSFSAGGPAAASAEMVLAVACKGGGTQWWLGACCASLFELILDCTQSVSCQSVSPPAQPPHTQCIKRVDQLAHPTPNPWVATLPVRRCQGAHRQAGGRGCAAGGACPGPAHRSQPRLGASFQPNELPAGSNNNLQAAGLANRPCTAEHIVRQPFTAVILHQLVGLPRGCCQPLKLPNVCHEHAARGRGVLVSAGLPPLHR